MLQNNFKQTQRLRNIFKRHNFKKNGKQLEETPSGVLHPVLVSPAGKGYGSAKVSPEEAHDDDQRAAVCEGRLRELGLSSLEKRKELLQQLSSS